MQTMPRRPRSSLRDSAHRGLAGGRFGGDFLQVMQEYFAAVTRKLGVDAELAQRKVQLLGRGRVVRFTEGDVIGPSSFIGRRESPLGMP